MDLSELLIHPLLIHSKYRPSPSFQSLCVGDESVAAYQPARSLGVTFDEHIFMHL